MDGRSLRRRKPINYAKVHSRGFDVQDPEDDLMSDRETQEIFDFGNNSVISPLKLNRVKSSTPAMSGGDELDDGKLTEAAGFDDGGETTDVEEEELLRQLESVTADLETAKHKANDRKMDIRRRIQEKKDQIKALEGNISQKDAKKKKSNVTLKELKDMKELDSLVDNQFKKLGIESSVGPVKEKVIKGKSFHSHKVNTDIVDVSESSYESSDSDSSDQSVKKRKKKRSGIEAKSSDRVKFPQVWPHSVLQNEYVSKSIKFHDLTFNQFVAGELEILDNRKLSSTERQGRLALLKKFVYYSEIYEMKGLLEFYAAWLRKIETGNRSWKDDPSEIEVPILTKYVKLNRPKWKRQGTSGHDTTQASDSQSEKDSEGRSAYVWFCPQYQRNKCVNKASHFSVVKGKMRNCQHICATCWQKDKKKSEHPECSKDCPNQ